MSDEEKEIDQITKNANSIIKNHMIWSMGAGFIPIPIVDLFAISAIQLDMIRQLTNLYEIDFKETEGKAYITSLTGGILSRIGARAVKFIPGVGSVLGGVTLAVLSGGSTYALGEVFKKHFSTGGTFLDFDPDRLKKYYDEQFEKGKTYAGKVKEEHQHKEAAVAEAEKKSDSITRLKELGELKANGIITEEEFNQLKKKMIEDL